MTTMTFQESGNEANDEISAFTTKSKRYQKSLDFLPIPRAVSFRFRLKNFYKIEQLVKDIKSRKRKRSILIQLSIRKKEFELSKLVNFPI